MSRQAKAKAKGKANPQARAASEAIRKRPAAASASASRRPQILAGPAAGPAAGPDATADPAAASSPELAASVSAGPTAVDEAVQPNPPGCFFGRWPPRDAAKIKTWNILREKFEEEKQLAANRKPLVSWSMLSLPWLNAWSLHAHVARAL